MDQKLLQYVYIGFLLPGLFSLTLVAEGIYKISKHEAGFFTFALGVLFLTGLLIVFYFSLKHKFMRFKEFSKLI